MPRLLTREAFKQQVFARSKNCCVLCGKPAVDAHHILDRKLFADGGYYLANGAAVCEECHWACETTAVMVEAVREASGITEKALPAGFSAEACYDKWGNECLPDGTRKAGPLFEDTGTRRALAIGNCLWRFNAY